MPTSRRQAARAGPSTRIGTQVVVTYHPAYLLRSPGEKLKAWEDLKLVLQLLGSRLLAPPQSFVVGAPPGTIGRPMTDIPVWGVDLTAVSLKAVKLALTSEGKVRAEAWEVIDFAEDVENVHGLGRHDAQKRALHSFLRHHDVKDCLVFASLRGESAFNRTVTVPQTGDQNLDRLLEYEAQQQIPYPLDDVFWDRRVVAIRENGDVIATIYAIQKSIVNERLSKLEMAGLPVDGLVLRPVALQNFCSRERLLEPGSVVIDVGYGATQVLLVHEDQTTFRCLARRRRPSS